jgi:ferredoxin-NADP reductase
MPYDVTLLEILKRTHDVNSYRVERPEGFTFVPGQATDFALLKPGWANEKRPFTFTGLPSEDFLEFTIKSYDDHNGVTHELRSAKKGDKFQISDPWGAIAYRGPGVFIAGGAGVTPFIAILRYLRNQNKIGSNKLFFSNKTEDDIILHEEFSDFLGDNFVNIITQQENTVYLKTKIDKEFLKNNITDFSQQFYVCGPDAFSSSVIKSLEELGAHPDSVIFEK